MRSASSFKEAEYDTKTVLQIEEANNRLITASQFRIFFIS